MRHKPTVFEALCQPVPWPLLDRLAAAHEHGPARAFSARQHLLAMLAGSLQGSLSLRQVAAGAAAQAGPMRLMGAGPVARSTLAEANRYRPASLFVDLFKAMLPRAHRTLRRDLGEAIRLIDATSLDLGKRMRRWMAPTQGKIAAKLHVIYDPARQVPVCFDLSSARVNDITAAKALPIETGTTYVFDLGYYDFGWWARLDAATCRFVTRLKRNTPVNLRESRSVTYQGAPGQAPDGTILADRIGTLNPMLSTTKANPYRKPVREILVARHARGPLRLVSNDLESPPEQIAQLYKERWQIELFFKWIKQNLKISRFIGASENAVRIQIACALIAYLLIRIAQASHATSSASSTLLSLVRHNLFQRRSFQSLFQALTKPPQVPTNPQLYLPLSTKRAGQ
jgi:transposase